MKNTAIIQTANLPAVNSQAATSQAVKTFKAGRIVTTLLSVIIFSFIAKSGLYAQDNKSIEGVMFNFITAGDTKVLQPYADAVSSDMNSGLFHSAKVKKGFSLYFGVKAIGTYVNGENPQVKDANNTLNIIPIAVPQLQLGAIFGTEISARYLPSIKIGSYGSVGMWGMGIKHGITSHFKKSPIDIAVGLAFNNLTIGDSKEKDMVQASSFAANLQVSKELSIFTLYTGLQYESSNIDVKVNYENVLRTMNYTNNNNIKALVGMNIKLGPVNLNGDYSFGKTNSVSAGFGFSF